MEVLVLGYKMYTCRRPSSTSSNDSKCWSWEERLRKNPLWKTCRTVWRWSHIYAYCPIPYASTYHGLVF